MQSGLGNMLDVQLVQLDVALGERPTTHTDIEPTGLCLLQ